MAVKQVTSSSGKTKWRATVWWRGAYISQATFDTKGLANAYEKTELERAIKGAAVPASVRREEREAAEALRVPMSSLVPGYLKENKHGDKRAAEYRLVGRLLADWTLADFQGEEGGRLIKRLLNDWRHLRLPRTLKAGAICASKAPVASQTLRLRMTALLRLIEYGRKHLPAGTVFYPPEDAYNFALPPAHENKRERRASDVELADLLRHVGVDSAFGQYLRVMDETGCRLSEISNATGAAVAFFGHDGEVLGGSLTLKKHKTAASVGTRVVPLSLLAARILHARKNLHGDGRLFPDLPVPNEICKDFDEACEANGIEDLMMKDMRREFISRNLREVSGVELRAFFGNSSLIEETPGDKVVMSAAGHTKPETTQGYTAPEQEEISFIFSKTSRWPRVQALIQGRAAQATERKAHMYARLRELSSALEGAARGQPATALVA